MINLPKKNIPKPSNPLKSLNWSKLPDLKVKDTIWMGVDDSRVGVIQLEWVWCNVSGCGLQVLVWCSVESEWLWSTSISVVLVKFTDEQYTTINQSTTGRFDPRVFVNCSLVSS